MLNRNTLGAWKDPLLHMAIVSAILMGAAMALDRRVSGSAGEIRHRANCHACSKCPPEEVAARDLFLWRNGCIEEPDLSN